MLELSRIMDERKLDLARKEEQVRQVETDLETAQAALGKLELEKGRLRREIEQTGLRLETLEQEIKASEEDARLMERGILETGEAISRSQGAGGAGRAADPDAGAEGHANGEAAVPGNPPRHGAEP